MRRSSEEPGPPAAARSCIHGSNPGARSHASRARSRRNASRCSARRLKARRSARLTDPCVGTKHTVGQRVIPLVKMNSAIAVRSSCGDMGATPLEIWYFDYNILNIRRVVKILSRTNSLSKGPGQPTESRTGFTAALTTSRQDAGAAPDHRVYVGQRYRIGAGSSQAPSRAARRASTSRSGRSVRVEPSSWPRCRVLFCI